MADFDERFAPLADMAVRAQLRGQSKPSFADWLTKPGGFSEGVPLVNQMVDQYFAPREQAPATPLYPDARPGSLASTLTDRDLGQAIDVAMSFSGGGLATRARDPALWHGLSDVKLRKPLSEMAAERSIVPSSERTISPEQLQGGVLLPALGDRSAIGGQLTKVGDVPLAVPTELQGGHGFMAADSPHAWASEQGRMTAMANRVKSLQERFGDVYSPYTAMGERSVDFSHHVSDTLSEMVKQSPVTAKGATSFDEIMRSNRGPKKDKKTGEVSGYDFPAVADWPGVNASNLREFLTDAPGNVRSKFAKFMDSGAMAKEGFPNVAEARFAVTDPRLLNVEPGASGLSIAKMQPLTSPSAHRTYSTGIHGDYVGGFGQSIPRDVMFPDIAEAYAARGFHPRQFQYLMERGTAPVHQETNQKWLDTVMNYMRQREQ